MTHPPSLCSSLSIPVWASPYLLTRWGCLPELVNSSCKRQQQQYLQKFSKPNYYLMSQWQQRKELCRDIISSWANLHWAQRMNRMRWREQQDIIWDFNPSAHQLESISSNMAAWVTLVPQPQTEAHRGTPVKTQVAPSWVLALQTNQDSSHTPWNESQPWDPFRTSKCSAGSKEKHHTYKL